MTTHPRDLEAADMARPIPRGAILVVDDDRILRTVVCHVLEAAGHRAIECSSGEAAVALLQEKSSPDIALIILDRDMPGMSGWAVIDFCKQHSAWMDTPIIMLTGADGSDDVRAGIDAGVFYYLTKPVDETLIASVTNAALRATENQRQLDDELAAHQASFTRMTSARFEVQTMCEARNLASFVANAFEEPARVVSGLAALLENAVEHGLYDLGFEAKGLHLQSGTLDAEIARRAAALSPGVVSATFHRTATHDVIEIKDGGAGFEWRGYLNLDPSRADLPHGRGIAQARLRSFDELRYNESGNTVQGFVKRGERFTW